MDSIRFEPPDGSSLPGGRSRRPPEDVAHRGALRLTFAYRRARVQLVLVEPIDMVVPPSMDITDQPPGAAFWFELEDRKGTTLYRRSQRSPMRPTVEVQTGNAEHPLAHLDAGIETGEFTLLVPSLPQAQAVAMFAWAAPDDTEKDDHPPAPVEIGRFPIGRGIDRDAIANDKTAPRTVSDALAAYDGAATIHLRGRDDSGQVASTHFRLDDGEARRGTVVTVKEPGEHSLAFWSIDRAGNVEAENQVTFIVHPRSQRGKS
jgi:hypothetical protein